MYLNKISHMLANFLHIGLISMMQWISVTLLEDIQTVQDTADYVMTEGDMAPRTKL